MSHVKFEIPADDLKRASEFYKAVFGWSTMDLPFNYVILDTHGKPVNPMASSGGISPRNDFVKAPVLIIPVDSIDETAKKIKDAGGEALNGKQQVGDFGFSMYIKDTEGSTMCLWEEIKK